jgi:O-antigen/teichoic acid export membrane protein
MLRLPQMQSEMGFQTAALFVLDGLANVTDFAFHFWMGRVLIPADFAVLQTLNSVMLVYTTVSGVFQPVVGRFVAEARGKGQDDWIRIIFQTFLRAAFWLGIILAVLVFFFSQYIAQLLNLPPWTIQVSAVLIFLSTLRPIPAGVLQGQENFVPFGLVRLALSLARIIFVFFVLRAGLGLKGAVLALPFGWFVSVLCAFLLLRKPLWLNGQVGSSDILRAGWKLSFYALLAYLAYMSLTSLDLVWVNRHLGSEAAGAYAALVLMRRIVALLPGVAVTVMFPRIAATLAQAQLPHRLLIRTASIILATSGLLTVFYFLFSERLLTLIFGSAYATAAPLLGWMGMAMIGVSLSSIWLNYYLAERPRTFVILLVIAVVLESLFLDIFSRSLGGAVLAFGLTGWLLTIAGLFLYLSKMPRLSTT